ncbi:MAG: hypothetical protein K8R89_07365 [Anaerolineae bacterium]|nr:hypothetical protein [Anaerolineae bacterium]
MEDKLRLREAQPQFVVGGEIPVGVSVLTGKIWTQTSEVYHEKISVLEFS